MTPHRRSNQSVSSIGFRLLLALVLVLSPLWSLAQMPPATIDAANATVDMPCHTGATKSDQQTKNSIPCPHCDGGGAAAQCQCCHYAAPAGAPVSMIAADIATYLAEVSAEPVPDSLPDSPRNRLYRPPIIAI